MTHGSLHSCLTGRMKKHSSAVPWNPRCVRTNFPSPQAANVPPPIIWLRSGSSAGRFRCRACADDYVEGFCYSGGGGAFALRLSSPKVGDACRFTVPQPVNSSTSQLHRIQSSEIDEHSSYDKSLRKTVRYYIAVFVDCFGLLISHYRDLLELRVQRAGFGGTETQSHQPCMRSPRCKKFVLIYLCYVVSTPQSGFEERLGQVPHDQHGGWMTCTLS
ncbi:hypothetical protein N7449_009753 [Penicillium cf. viridicatum]|uniref:Uncharacterized protein n=1 Tax=Penicillium cf. viridicatum TaxID=2972119 RepID=A0A9W9JCU0_9EURO|nr:hypothetical protein N7449_009753 [Penicillium cf. viridicatum]